MKKINIFEKLFFTAKEPLSKNIFWLLKRLDNDENSFNLHIWNKGGWRNMLLQMWINKLDIKDLNDDLQETKVCLKLYCKSITHSNGQCTFKNGNGETIDVIDYITTSGGTFNVPATTFYILDLVTIGTDTTRGFGLYTPQIVHPDRYAGLFITKNSDLEIGILLESARTFIELNDVDEGDLILAVTDDSSEAQTSIELTSDGIVFTTPTKEVSVDNIVQLENNIISDIESVVNSESLTLSVVNGATEPLTKLELTSENITLEAPNTKILSSADINMTSEDTIHLNAYSDININADGRSRDSQGNPIVGSEGGGSVNIIVDGVRLVLDATKLQKLITILNN